MLDAKINKLSLSLVTLGYLTFAAFSAYVSTRPDAGAPMFGIQFILPGSLIIVFWGIASTVFLVELTTLIQHDRVSFLRIVLAVLSAIPTFYLIVLGVLWVWLRLAT